MSSATLPEHAAAEREHAVVEVRPLSGNIGAEIFGVDLRQPLDPAEVAAIRTALLRWKVVFFRDQDITRDQQIAFGSCFGKVTLAHPTLPAAFPEHPQILVIDNQRAFSAGTSNVDNRWHTDVSFAINPPMGSILRARTVPEYGGDTQWTNLALAYSRLSEPIRTLIDGLWAVHTNRAPVEDLDEDSSAFQGVLGATDLRSRHPVVCVHPETGERILYVNPQWTSHISGVRRPESEALMQLLCSHIARPEFTVRFRWQPNSIAFWDNRATAHLIPRDIPAGSHRSMERITIAGEVPVSVAGVPSTALSGSTF